jgi:hypothetical protein
MCPVGVSAILFTRQVAVCKMALRKLLDELACLGHRSTAMLLVPCYGSERASLAA